METLDKISEVLTSEVELHAQLAEVEQELENLLMKGANDENLVDKKRKLLKELYTDSESYKKIHTFVI